MDLMYFNISTLIFILDFHERGKRCETRIHQSIACFFFFLSALFFEVQILMFWTFESHSESLQQVGNLDGRAKCEENVKLNDISEW